MKLASLPGVTVEVQDVSKRSFKESNHDDHGDAVECYIAAIPGAAFTVSLDISPSSKLRCKVVSWTVYVDGQRIQGRNLSRAMEWRTEGLESEHGLRIQPMMFSEMAFGDEPTVKISKERATSMGTIHVEMCEATILNSTPWQGQVSGRMGLEQNNEIYDERIFKGQDVKFCARFGPARVGTPVGTSTTVRSGPLYRFTFNYGTDPPLAEDDVRARAASNTKQEPLVKKEPGAQGDAYSRSNVKIEKEAEVKPEPSSGHPTLHTPRPTPAAVVANNEDDEVVFLFTSNSRKRKRTVVDLDV
ncbi:Hypothetical protein D9617_4g000640 [Elsinoe fawcettii]|nr:Hypothetical protein D9617_4g000640 [Elsinoe fawcettii]